MLHIEGMGLLGSLLANHLDDRGVDFTWSDTDSTTNAWSASTGLVYPAGDARSMHGLEGWRSWAETPWGGPVVEEVRYTYHHRNPPHDGRYTPDYDLGDMRVAPRQPGCFAVNVQALVLAARTKFHGCRAPYDGGPRVRAHGFTERLGAYMWGWTVPVALEYPDDLEASCGALRPAFYSRRDRFQIVYAYPIAHQPDDWWAGSSLVSQKAPHPLDAEKHYARWLEAFTVNFPRVEVVSRGEPIQGWRPRPTVEPDDDHLVLVEGDQVTFPPLWHSGVRWAPVVIEKALERLS